MELNELISAVNDAVWGYALIYLLVGCGLWFTWRTRFVQFRMVGEMLRLLTDTMVDTVETQVQEPGKRQKHISSFQAFAVSVATRVGTGNLAGVASAIAVGGPGAVFWMWVIALVGSATATTSSAGFISGGWPSRLPYSSRCSSDSPTTPSRPTPSVEPCTKPSDGHQHGWEVCWL